jgi:uncharacterized SAM-binding protein YcdF (DUF218 family)
LLFAIVLVGLIEVPLLRGMGSFLIVEDPLEPAAAIVSLGGHVPFREMEAAKLYREGWAPRVIVVRAAANAEAEALQALKIHREDDWELSIRVLIEQGVPKSAIVVPAQAGIGTLEELQAAYTAIPAKDARVIFVTSKFHTRRTRLTWNYVSGGKSPPIVRAASADPFDPERWWQVRSFVLAVVREYLGLVNYYAGFPVGAGR